MDKISKEGLTFDDVLLVPGPSDILPRDIDVSTHLTRNLRLEVPIMSAVWIPLLRPVWLLLLLVRVV